jgi:hypothetical protein
MDSLALAIADRGHPLFNAIGRTVWELDGERYLDERGELTPLPQSWGVEPWDAADAYRKAHPLSPREPWVPSKPMTFPKRKTSRKEAEAERRAAHLAACQREGIQLPIVVGLPFLVYK